MISPALIKAILRNLPEDATAADAIASWDAAADWLISTPAQEAEAWYVRHTDGSETAPALRDETGALVDEWVGIVVLHRAIACPVEAWTIH